MQEEWRTELGLDKKETDKIYYLLEWCDAFSLLICQHQLQPEKKGIEISTGPNGTVYQLYQIDDNALTVEPWPFEVDTFSINYESREIKQLKFENSAEFRKAFIDAAVKENVWEITKTSGKIKKPAKV